MWETSLGQEWGGPDFLSYPSHVPRLAGVKPGSSLTRGISQKVGFSSSADLIFNLGNLSFEESVAFGWRPISKALCMSGWGQQGFFPHSRGLDEGLESQL